jgi:hypothetical protein
MEKATVSAKATATVTRNVIENEVATIWGFYTVECYDANGDLKWADKYMNLVVNVGKSDALDKYFKGSAYTAAFYIGLVDGASAPTYNAADTMGSHAGWTESTAYSNANRVTAVFGTATASGGGAGAPGTGSIVTSAAVFNINATATIAGCFVTTNNTKGGTTGTLFSSGSFSGGNRAVVNGDTLNVTWTGNN